MEYHERDMDWASVIITYIYYSIRSSAQSHIHNKTLVWMSTEDSNAFVILSFSQNIIYWIIIFNKQQQQQQPS